MILWNIFIANIQIYFENNENWRFELECVYRILGAKSLILAKYGVLNVFILAKNGYLFV